MIEAATRTQGMRVLGATTVGLLMLIPPTFWADIVSTASGFLIPEAIIAILFLVLAAFTGGSMGAALMLRLTTFAMSVARRLRGIGPAGRAAARAGEIMSNLAALHDPDMIAGGYDAITRVGDAGVNSSIGGAGAITEVRTAAFHRSMPQHAKPQQTQISDVTAG